MQFKTSRLTTQRPLYDSRNQLDLPWDVQGMFRQGMPVIFEVQSLLLAAPTTRSRPTKLLHRKRGCSPNLSFHSSRGHRPTDIVGKLSESLMKLMRTRALLTLQKKLVTPWGCRRLLGKAAQVNAFSHEALPLLTRNGRHLIPLMVSMRYLDVSRFDVAISMSDKSARPRIGSTSDRPPKSRALLPGGPMSYFR